MKYDPLLLALMVGSFLLLLGLGLCLLYGKEDHFMIKSLTKNPYPEADSFCEKRGITRMQLTRAMGRVIVAWSPVYVALYFLVIQPAMEETQKDVIPTEMIIGGVAIIAYMAAVFYYFIFLDTKKKDY